MNMSGGTHYPFVLPTISSVTYSMIVYRGVGEDGGGSRDLLT